MSPLDDRSFDSKEAARTAVWDLLAERKQARFPFPPHGRIPNFAGARQAAERLLAHPRLAGVRRIKINPDAPQRPVRELALARGITVFVPPPRLKGGFKRLDPETIPPEHLRDAASLSKMNRWAETVRLEELPQLEAIVAGAVAVTRDGRRCGKGEGYSDLEYAILRELGHDPAPVVTTVHPLQIVGSFPEDVHDLPLSLIVTPQETIEVDAPPPPPGGLDWDRIGAEEIEAMPVLGELTRPEP